jgi:hypothetical protein
MKFTAACGLTIDRGLHGPCIAASHRIIAPLMSSRDKLGMECTVAASHKIQAPFWSPK